MENPEEILRCLEEFSKFKPKDIPRELEEYLCFVAKTGDPVYQWGSIKHLLKEKLITVVNEFYESCPWVDIPQCPNVEIFNYETMKSFILERLETFSAAPFTVQRICELLTTPRKEYNRIDKFMRALEKNILVVSTIEPGCKSTENGDSESIMNGLESEHLEDINCGGDVNVVKMEETTVWQKNEHNTEIQTAEIQETISTDSVCPTTQYNVPDEKKAFSLSETEETPVNSSVEDNNESLINVESLSSNNDEESTNEPVEASIEVASEVTESSEALMENESDEKLEKSPDEPENVKQADSTTKFQAETTEPIWPNSQESFQSAIIDETICEIANSSSENTVVSVSDSRSNVLTEPDALDEDENEISQQNVCEESNVDSNEAKEVINNLKSDVEVAVACDEDSSCFQEKEEEITSSDKIVVAVPNTSLDDISDDEAEAEAEAEVVGKEENESSNISSGNNIESQVTASNISAETESSENCVSASSDDDNLGLKDYEDVQMEVDIMKDKPEFNEAEATTCDSV